APGSLAVGMAAAATRFLDALDAATLARATFPFADAERRRWHWTTPSNVPRNGLPLTALDEARRALAFDLLRASLSEAGYREARDIMSLQRDLGNDPDDYYVTVCGTPGAAAPWGWRFEGHYLSRHFAVAGDEVVGTPFFLAAWPTETGAGLRAMEREEGAARELVRSLLAEGRDDAVFQADSLSDHLTQNEPQVSPLDPIGVAAGDFAADQRALLDEILAAYLGTLPPGLAVSVTDRVEAAGRKELHFGWAGSVEPLTPHYYRVQGPTFLLEFGNSRNGGTHIHSVWRDFEQDFGAHLT
ncbi:MAG: DUF3500 domain-containing protein, partial [Chloroflexota bacterium]|nr:DUF3500 domain-containing protein [Chloroflexota bacterium]